MGWLHPGVSFAWPWMFFYVPIHRKFRCNKSWVVAIATRMLLIDPTLEIPDEVRGCCLDPRFLVTGSTDPLPCPTIFSTVSKLLRVVVNHVVDGRGVVVVDGPFRLRITSCQFHSGWTSCPPWGLANVTADQDRSANVTFNIISIRVAFGWISRCTLSLKRHFSLSGKVLFLIEKVIHFSSLVIHLEMLPNSTSWPWQTFIFGLISLLHRKVINFKCTL